MEERARAKEKLEKDIRKGFEFIFSQEYQRPLNMPKNSLKPTRKTTGSTIYS